MRQIENSKNRVRSIPEFSEKNYNIVGYVFAALITIAGLFLIYEVITTDALVFKANWNMFKSPLGNLCWFIGFFWAIAWWGKFTHWSATPITKTYDQYGSLKKVEEDYDDIDFSKKQTAMSSEEANELCKKEAFNNPSADWI